MVSIYKLQKQYLENKKINVYIIQIYLIHQASEEDHKVKQSTRLHGVDMPATQQELFNQMISAVAAASYGQLDLSL